MLQRMWIVVFASTASLLAQTAGERPRTVQRYVVHRVTITVLPDSTDRDVPFTLSQLYGMLTVQPTSLSVPSRILREITYNGLDVPDFPRPITMIFARAYAEAVAQDLRYFDRSSAEYDVLRLMDFLNQYGYHDARVRYVFRVRQRARNNELEYIIHLGKRYALDTVVVSGLGELPFDIRLQVERIIASFPLGKPYAEVLIRQIIETLLDTLRNRGYVRAGYGTDLHAPTVLSGSCRLSPAIPSANEIASLSFWILALVSAWDQLQSLIPREGILSSAWRSKSGSLSFSQASGIVLGALIRVWQI